MPNQYAAEATLMPVAVPNGSSTSSLGGQFRGLASLAGIGISEGVDRDKSQAVIQLLQSWDFLRDRYVLKAHSAARIQDAEPARRVLRYAYSVCSLDRRSAVFVWLCLLNAKLARLAPLDSRGIG